MHAGFDGQCGCIWADGQGDNSRDIMSLSDRSDILHTQITGEWKWFSRKSMSSFIETMASG